MGPTDGNDMVVRGSLPDMAVGISIPISIYISMMKKTSISVHVLVHRTSSLLFLSLSLGMVDIAFIRYI